MRTPNTSPRRRAAPASIVAAFLAPLLLSGLALSPVASAQQTGAVELGPDEARLELAVDLDTAWELLLRALEPVAYGEELVRPAEGWLQVHDTWVTAEPMPWMDGTWTRLRTRVGGFSTDLEHARAESLLNTVQALWTERQAYAVSTSYRPSTGNTVVYQQPATTVVVTSPAYNSVYYAPAWCSPMLWYGPTWWSSCYTRWGYYPGSYVAFGYTWDDWHIGVGWSQPHHVLAGCGHYHAYGYACYGKSYAYGYGYYGYYDPWWFHGHHGHDCDCGKCDKDWKDDDWKDDEGKGDDFVGPTRDRDRPRDVPDITRRLTDVARGNVDVGVASRGSSGRTSSSLPSGTLTISSGGVTRTITTTGGRSQTLPSLTRSASVPRTSGRIYDGSGTVTTAGAPIITTGSLSGSSRTGWSGSRSLTPPSSSPVISTSRSPYGISSRSSVSAPTIRTSAPTIRSSAPTIRSTPTSSRPTSVSRPSTSFGSRSSASFGSSRGSSSVGSSSRSSGSSSGRGRR